MTTGERTVKPDPDPTILTTESLLREIAHLKELTEHDLEGLQQQTTQQFDLVERQRVEQKSDTKTAVDAALSAQKEAVREQTTASERAIAKSEQGTTKQLDQLAANFDTAIKGVTTQLDDLKERVTRFEVAKTTTTENVTERRADSNQSWSQAATIIFGLGFVISLVALILFHK